MERSGLSPGDHRVLDHEDGERSVIHYTIIIYIIKYQILSIKYMTSGKSVLDGMFSGGPEV